MTRTEVIEKLRERGYTVTAFSNDSDGNPIAVHAITDPLTNAVHGCIIYIATDEFELSYSVPGSINTLSTSKCGPFMNDEHFNHIRDKFVSQAEVLAKVFGNK